MSKTLLRCDRLVGLPVLLSPRLRHRLLYLFLCDDLLPLKMVLEWWSACLDSTSDLRGAPTKRGELSNTSLKPTPHAAVPAVPPGGPGDNSYSPCLALGPRRPARAQQFAWHSQPCNAPIVLPTIAVAGSCELGGHAQRAGAGARGEKPSADVADTGRRAPTSHVSSPFPHFAHAPGELLRPALLRACCVL